MSLWNMSYGDIYVINTLKIYELIVVFRYKTQYGSNCFSRELFTFF